MSVIVPPQCLKNPCSNEGGSPRYFCPMDREVNIRIVPRVAKTGLVGESTGQQKVKSWLMRRLRDANGRDGQWSARPVAVCPADCVCPAKLTLAFAASDRKLPSNPAASLKMNPTNRFVILFHQMPPDGGRADHWDWMFERDGTLRTWACEQPPDDNMDANAILLDDHRLVYLEYEGPIAGDRGRVSRILSGDMDWEEISPRRYRAKLIISSRETEFRDAKVWLVELTRRRGREYRLVVRPDSPPAR